MTTRRWFALACLWAATLFWSVVGVPSVGASDPVESPCPTGSETGVVDDTRAGQVSDAVGSDDETCPPDSMGRVRPAEPVGSSLARNAATVGAAAGLIVIGALVFRFAHRAKLTG